MAFLDQSQEEAEREEREREEARQREVAQAKALAKARARSATIFKFACVGVTILMLVAVYASIVATQSKKLAEVKTIQVEKELIKQANRSYSISKSLKKEGKLDLSSAWLADAINLSKSDDTLTSELLDEYLNDIIFTPKIKTILDCSNNIVDVKTDENNIYVLTDKEVEVFELSSYQKTVLPFNNTSSIYSRITDDLRYVIHFNDYNTVGAWDLTNKSTSGSYSLPPSLRFLLNKYVYHSNLGVVVVPFRGSQNGFLAYDLNKNLTQIVHTKSSIDNIGFLDNSLFTSYYDYKKKTTTINQWEGLSLGLNIKSKNQYFVTGRVKGLLFPPPGTTDEVVVISKPKSTSPVIQVGKIKSNKFQVVNSLSLSKGFRKSSLSKDGRFIYFIDDDNKLNKASFNGEMTFADAEEEYASYIISPDNAMILGITKQNNINLISTTNGEKIKKTIVLGDSDSKVVFDKSCQEFVLYNNGNKMCIVDIPLYNDINDVSFPGRYSPVVVGINATKPFKKYKLIFTELKTPGIEAFQLSEINFYDSNGIKMLNPDDLIEVTEDNNTPLGEEISKIIDGKLNTKHLNFNTDNPGFTVQPSNGKKILSKIILYSANDMPGRDPSKYRLEGTVDGVSYEVISEGAIVSNDYLKSKNSLGEKLRQNIINNNRNYLSIMTAMATGCRISQSGKVDYLNFNELHEMFKKNSNVQIAGYLKSSSRGNSDWHMITLLKNSMDYFDPIVGNPFTVLYHYRYLSDSEKTQSNFMYQKGLSHFILGDMLESEKTLEKQIALDNSDLQTLYELAIIHVYNMNYDKALSAIDNALTQNVLRSNRFWAGRFNGLYLNIPKKLNDISHTKVMNFLNLDEDSIKELPTTRNLETTENPYVEIPSNILLDFEEGITIQSWIKPQDNQIFGRIINKGGDSRQDGYSVNYYWGQLFFELYNASTAEHGWLRHQINITDWTRFTATWDIKDATMRLYINGNLVSDEIVFEGPIGLTKQQLNIGRSSSMASYSNAQISNVYLWNYSLSDTEIKNSFEQPQNLLKKTAVADWEFAPDTAGVLNCANNSELNGRIYNTEIKANEVEHEFIKNYIPFTVASVEFTQNNSLFQRISLLLKNEQYKEIISLFDSERDNSKQLLINADYFERDNPFECLVMAYCFSQLKDLTKSRLFYEKYERIKDISNQTQMDYRFNMIRESFNKYLISHLKFIE
jgi:tetratricopeptide (TPR) repeat protein